MFESILLGVISEGIEKNHLNNKCELIKKLTQLTNLESVTFRMK